MSPVPKPKDVLAVAPDSNTKAEPLPTMIPPSVFAKAEIASKSASYACTSEPIAKPKAVLAPEADVPPVPPLAIASVPPTCEPSASVPPIEANLD